jgi:fucose 4-O-acetylase-like acetyltransferase
MDSPSGPTTRPGRLGIYLALGYLCLVVALYAFTAHYTKPENVGYDWIPFILLAMGPWYRMGQEFWWVALILNASLLYIAGTLLQKLQRRSRG